jgi:putative DNA primase/helicase
MSALDHVFGAVEPPLIIQKTRRRLKPVVVAVDPPKAVEPSPARFELLTAEQVRKRPRLQWAVLNAVPLSGVMAIYGPSGCGKSFLTIDLTAALAEEGEWFGHRVKKSCRVVYLALEGAEGIRQRVEAWEKFHERAFPANVKFVFDAFHINDRNNVLHLSAAIDSAGGADAIVLDTLNRAAPDSDENSSRDMGMSLEGCKELQSMTGALVMLVSHTGKDTTKGLGEEDGEPITSCAVRADMSEPPATRPRVPKGGNQRVIYDALQPLLRESGMFGKAGAPAMRPCLELEIAITQTRDRLAVPSDRRTERTRQAITGLVSTGVLGCNEGWIWLK